MQLRQCVVIEERQTMGASLLLLHAGWTIDEHAVLGGLLNSGHPYNSVQSLLAHEKSK